MEIREIEERYQYLTNLEKRKEEVLHSIEEQDKLTAELESEIKQATQLQRVEDLYLPYRQKRRTLATIAKEKGLEPFAEWLMTFPEEDLAKEAEKYIHPEEELETVEDVYSGVHEILAEYTSDNADFRKWIRAKTMNSGKIEVTVKDEEADEKGVYQMYYEYDRPVNKLASHQVLAINRGEKEKILTVKVIVDEQEIRLSLRSNGTVTSDFWSHFFGSKANEDAYKRFIQPAIEREIRATLTEDAEDQAIDVFGDNLRNLLLQAPLKGQTILGFDPAYRTGCKLAAVDETGKLLGIKVIYPHKPASKSKREAAKGELIDFIEKHHIDTIAIGNGTASRESEQFVADLLKEIDRKVSYVIVNEAGASVYPASAEARREFPDLEVEERRSYCPSFTIPLLNIWLTHWCPAKTRCFSKEIDGALGFCCRNSCNQVGVNLNTASAALLQHISGLTKRPPKHCRICSEMVYLTTETIKSKRLGPKAFEQSAGFYAFQMVKNCLIIQVFTQKLIKKSKFEITDIRKEVGTDEVKKI